MIAIEGNVAYVFLTDNGNSCWKNNFLIYWNFENVFCIFYRIYYIKKTTDFTLRLVNNMNPQEIYVVSRIFLMALLGIMLSIF